MTVTQRNRIKAAIEPIVHNILADTEGAGSLSDSQFKGCVQSVVGRSVEFVDDEIEVAIEVLKNRRQS